MQEKNQPDQQIDYGPAQRGNHDIVEIGARKAPDGTPAHGAKVVTQRPLDRYIRRALITPEQYSAGMKIYKAWRNAGGEKRICHDYNQRIAKGTGEASENRIISEVSYREALTACGNKFSPVIVAVCLIGESADAWAKSTSRNPQSGIEYLRDALDMLCDHYKKAYTEQNTSLTSIILSARR